MGWMLVGLGGAGGGESEGECFEGGVVMDWLGRGSLRVSGLGRRCRWWRGSLTCSIGWW